MLITVINGLRSRELSIKTVNGYMKMAVGQEKYEEAAGMKYGIEEYEERSYHSSLKKLLDSNEIKNEIIP